MSRPLRWVDAWVWLVYGFMYLPIAVILIFSFNDSEMIAFPLRGFTTHWYQAIFADTRLTGALGLTFLVSLPVALASTLLGAMAALALTRYRLRFRVAFLVMLFVPFLIPKVILAVAQLILLSELGIERSLWTVIAAQTIIILPFTVLVIASVLIRIDRRLEEAAADLGASGVSIFRRVTLPLMKNGLLAAYFIAFVLSSSEYVLTSFVSGRSQPLSILVASDFRFNISPTLDALALLIVLANLLLIGLGEFARLKARR
ncbi:ABC transporter permease [Kaistia sp. MMO-174]|mgnify:CR=1 FL=1|uniref:ABC transporter permease n=1 Tax=Kaistia sp. MMO-174 TaxID=3081256 RepID=UPI001AC054C3|nr:ABC transporter permease [Hyphomicrobiales bacterium]